MAEPSTIARPYAEAAFRLADAQGKLADWSAALANLSAVAADERVRAAIGDPNLPRRKGRGPVHLDPRRQAHGRGRELRARAGGERPPRRAAGDPRAVRGAEERARRRGRGRGRTRRSTMDAGAGRRPGVAAGEEAPAARSKARVSVDKSLIGGVKIVIGDKVIDGSARAQLGALETALKALSRKLKEQSCNSILPKSRNSSRAASRTWMPARRCARRAPWSR